MSGVTTVHATLPQNVFVQQSNLTPTITNTFEGGTNGTNITPGNSGGANGTAFSNVTLNAGVTAQYSNAATVRAGSTLSGAITYVTDAAGYLMHALSPSTTTSRVVARAYVYAGTITAGSALSEAVLSIRNSSVQMVSIGFTPTGYVFVNSIISNNIAISAVQVSLNTWYRYELAVSAGTTTSNGRVQYGVYLGDGKTSILTGDTGFTTNTGVLIPAFVRYGRSANTGVPARTLYFDDCAAAVDVPTGFIAPAA